MSFPQLLRRSSFAQHDPLITRIYTTTPSSISKHGDWGLKYPIHRAKGPRYVRVSNLDAGSAIGTDWRSGEKEARFMETWGSGRVQFSKERDALAGFRSQRNDFDSFGDTGTPQPKPAIEGRDDLEYVEDIESMSEKEFERYLEGIRARRSELLPIKLDKMDEKHKAGWTQEEGDLTLANLGVEGYGNDLESASMQTGLVKEKLGVPGSKVLKGTSTAMKGLSYSRDLPNPNRQSSSSLGRSAPPVDPTRVFPGRVLNLRDDREHLRSRPGANDLMPSRSNRPFVVSVGGVTAHASPNIRSSDNNILELTDYTRTEPEAGLGAFRVTAASIEGSPDVVGTDKSLIQKRYTTYPFDRISGSKRPGPLEAVTPDIRVEAVTTSSSQAQTGAEESDRRRVLLGSREWVAQDPSLRKTFSREDALGLGGPRSSRIRGRALQGLSEAERRQSERNAQAAQKSRTASMLERLRLQASTPGSERGKR